MPYLLSGISVGGQYALIAVGYTMVYGILRLINFAHGDVFMVAGLMMVYAVTWMPLWLAVPFVIVMTVVLGFVIERVAYKPLRSAPRMSVMISAIGVSYLLQNLALYVTGGLNKNYPTIPWISDTVSVFGATTKMVTLVTPVLTLVLVVLLVLLIAERTGAAKITLVLAGVAVSGILSAGIDAIVTFWPDALNGYSDFRIGSLANLTMPRIAPAFWVVLIALALLFTLTNELDVLMLGQETAHSLGLKTGRMRVLLLALAAALAGAAVSFAGLIGFVGLIVPHIMRRFAGDLSLIHI